MNFITKLFSKFFLLSRFFLRKFFSISVPFKGKHGLLLFMTQGRDVNVRLPGLDHLQFSWDAVESAVLLEKRSCLLEKKGNMVSQALVADVENPGIFTKSCRRA